MSRLSVILIERLEQMLEPNEGQKWREVFRETAIRFRGFTMKLECTICHVLELVASFVTFSMANQLETLVVISSRSFIWLTHRQ